MVTVGVGLLAARLVHHEDVRSVSFAERPQRVEIRLGAGRVELHGGDGDAVGGQRTTRYTWLRPNASERLERGTLHIDAGCRRFLAPCSVDYRLDVPRGVAVDIRSGSGSVELTSVDGGAEVKVGSGGVHVSGARGAVSVATGSGAISLTGVEGSLHAKTGSGSVDGTAMLSRQLEVSTGSGHIDLALLTDADSLTARTGSGAIALSVPGGPYRVTTRTGSGRSTVGVPTDTNALHVIEASTGSGSIDIASSSDGAPASPRPAP